MKVTVVFDAMRHGLKDGDALTPEGLRQVTRTARTNLRDRNYRFVFFSGMGRAFETVQIVLDTLDALELVIPEPIREEGFGYAWAMDDRFPIENANDDVRAAVSADNTENVVDLWLTVWPVVAASIRGRFRGTLEGWARMIATDDRLREKGEPIHCLIGSHSPCAELACLDPKTFPKMNETDICRYTLEVDDETGQVGLVSSKYIPAPTDS